MRLIPQPLDFEHGEPTSGPWEIGVAEAANPTPVGEHFLVIGNVGIGRSVARVSAVSRLDAEDMGNAHLLAAAPKLRDSLIEVLLYWEPANDHEEATLERASDALAESQGE